MSGIEPRDSYETVAGLKARYRLYGGQGSVVLLLHGLGGFLECWRRNVESLARSHRVYAIDLPGHGLTDKPDAIYDLDYLADFVRTFLSTQSVPRVALVGLSLGGAISLRFAARYPDMVDRLVLAGSAGLGPLFSPFFRFLALPLPCWESWRSGPPALR